MGILDEVLPASELGEEFPLSHHIPTARNSSIFILVEAVKLAGSLQLLL